MTELGIPVWGQYSLTGVAIGVVIWVVIAVLSGRMITGREQDRRDAKAREDLDRSEKRSEKWQEAFQESQAVQAQLADVAGRFASGMEVFEKFIHDLPQVVRDDES